VSQLVATALSEVTYERAGKMQSDTSQETKCGWEFDGLSDTIVNRLIISVMIKPAATKTNLPSRALTPTMKEMHHHLRALTTT
jgi:hypothetical protein